MDGPEDSKRDLIILLYEEANRIEDDRVRAEVMAELDRDRDYVLSLGRVVGCAYVSFLGDKVELPGDRLVFNLQAILIPANEITGDERQHLVIPPIFSIVLLEQQPGFKKRLQEFARRLEAAIQAAPTAAVRFAAGVGEVIGEELGSLLQTTGEGEPEIIDPQELELLRKLTRQIPLGDTEDFEED